MADDLKVTQIPAAFAELARKHNALVELLKSMEGRSGIKVTTSDNNIIVSIEGTVTTLSVETLTVTGDATIAGSLEVSGGITGDLTGDVTGTATSFAGNLIGEVTGTMEATYVAGATSYNTALSVVRRGANGEASFGHLFTDSITVVYTVETDALVATGVSTDSITAVYTVNTDALVATSISTDSITVAYTVNTDALVTNSFSTGSISVGVITSSRFAYDDATISVIIDGNGLVATRASGGYAFTLNPAQLTHSMSVITLDVCDSGSPAQILVLGSATF